MSGQTSTQVVYANATTITFPAKLLMEYGAVLVDRRKIFNRSSRNAPLGASRLNFSGNIAAR
jgi:hypothetical protein